jgi:pimeloyl-ACP methyl ester carboxylesterase
MQTTLARNPVAAAILVALAGATAADAQERIANVNGVQLHYQVEGQGEPLVLIHGWALDLRMWDLQVRALGRRFKVIRYDRRGFAKSSGGEDLSWDAADLAALLDSIGVRRAHVLGMSQGARVALQFVRDYPERVASLTLQSASPPERFPLAWSGVDAPRFEEWTKLVREKGLEAFRPVWAHHPLMRVPTDRPDAQRRLDIVLAGYRGARFLNPSQPSGPVAPSGFEDLPRITVPTLVITSEGEVPFLQLVARTYGYYIANARLEVIPGGGHMVNLIEPERFNAIVSRFLDRVIAARK